MVHWDTFNTVEATVIVWILRVCEELVEYVPLPPNGPVGLKTPDGSLLASCAVMVPTVTPAPPRVSPMEIICAGYAAPEKPVTVKVVSLLLPVNVAPMAPVPLPL